MKKTLIALAALVICALPLVASADWDPCHPDPDTKFYQLPDPLGWDIRVTTPKLLADDFVCISTDYITDVHFWGSWEAGVVGEITGIHVSFHADVPAGADTPWSHPGEELWAKDLILDEVPAGSVVIQDAVSGPQGWYDPNEPNDWVRYDHTGMVQVNIFLDQIFELSELFIQEGTRAVPMIYWLDLQVDVAPPPGTTALPVDFGWKTSVQHFQDDAVWADWGPDCPAPVGDQWAELIDPETGESLDLAFVITGIPVPEPGIMVLSGLGLLALLARRRKK